MTLAFEHYLSTWPTSVYKLNPSRPAPPWTVVWAITPWPTASRNVRVQTRTSSTWYHHRRINHRDGEKWRSAHPNSVIPSSITTTCRSGVWTRSVFRVDWKRSNSGLDISRELHLENWQERDSCILRSATRSRVSVAVSPWNIGKKTTTLSPSTCDLVPRVTMPDW